MISYRLNFYQNEWFLKLDKQQSLKKSKSSSKKSSKNDRSKSANSEKTKENIATQKREVLDDFDTFRKRKKKNKTLFSDQDDFLMTALFGEPLKIYNETQIDPYISVDFTNEINDIKKVINRVSLRKENFRVAPLNVETLVKTLASSPDIIHIMTHGRMTNNAYEFDFEGHKAFKESLSKEQVEELIGMNGLQDNILVFLNCCYSGIVGGQFLSKGAECVIQIHPDTPINDTVARQFSSRFYSLILEKKMPFGLAFDLARLHTKFSPDCRHALSKNIVFCNHKHNQECFQKQKNFQKVLDGVHQYLSQKCKCPEKYLNVHYHECIVMFEKELRLKNAKIHKEMLSDSERYLICCCNLKLPHEDWNKFQIGYREDEMKFKTIDDFTNKRKIKIRNQLFFLEPAFNHHFSKMKLNKSRFNDTMFQFYNFFSFNRGKIGIVYGQKGSSLSKFLISFSGYVLLRAKYHFVHQFNFLKVETVDQMKECLNAQNQEFANYLKKKKINFQFKQIKILYICHKSDRILEEMSAVRLFEYFEKIHSEFNLHFLVSLRKKPSRVVPYAKILKIQPMKEIEMERYFLSKLSKGKCIYKDQILIEFRLKKTEILKLFKKYLCYPKSLRWFIKTIDQPKIDLKKWETNAIFVNQKIQISENLNIPDNIKFPFN